MVKENEIIGKAENEYILIDHKTETKSFSEEWNKWLQSESAMMHHFQGLEIDSFVKYSIAFCIIQLLRV